MRRAKRLFWLLACVYLAICAVMYVFQRSLMYFPTHRDVPAKGRPPFDPWVAPDGTYLGYFRDSPAPKRVVVLFHGNGGEAIDRDWVTRLIRAQESVIVLAEHPGYGAKAGDPTEASLVEAGHRVVAEARARWRLPVTVMGESLGTGVACAVAADPGVDRVALISPFFSTLDVAKRHYPFLPVALLMKDTYRSDLALTRARVPLHIIHGTDDDVVAFDSGKALFEAYQGPQKTFTPVPGAKHNDMYAYVLRADEAAAFREFVRGN